jgi:phosphate/sulfate permease
MLICSLVGVDVAIATQVLPQIEAVDSQFGRQIFWSVILINCCLGLCIAILLLKAWKKVVKHQTMNDEAGFNLVRERETKWMDWVDRSTQRKNDKRLVLSANVGSDNGSDSDAEIEGIDRIVAADIKGKGQGEDHILHKHTVRVSRFICDPKY